MKIGIDISALNSGHKVRGMGFYTKNLIENLRLIDKTNEYIFFIPGEKVPSIDLIHYPAFDIFYPSLPFLKTTKTIVTIHDTIPLIFPKQYPAGLRGSLSLLYQKLSLKNTAAIITDSENSKKDINKYLNVPEEKIHVIYLAADKIFSPIKNKKLLKQVTDKFWLPEKFVLYVGDINYNKNILTLIRSCKTLQIPLVICGKQAFNLESEKLNLKKIQGPRDFIRYFLGQSHPELAHFSQLLKEFQENKNIIRLGFVNTRDLVALYNLATLYIQPSLYEGFGLPVIEAMSCACPVVCSNTSSLPEVAGKAGIFINPESEESMTAGINKVLNLSRKNYQNLKKQSLEQAKKFSWEKTAQKTLQIYEQVAKNN